MRSTLPSLLLVCTVACSGPHPLANALASPEALAHEVLGAIQRRDLARLHDLALDAREFERRVWPGLPAAQPGRNLPWSYVWTELRQKSDTMLKRTLSDHGGTRYVLEHVSFQGETKYGTYFVHRRSVLAVRDERGDRHELRVLGSMIEADGGWKVFSYVVE